MEELRKEHLKILICFEVCLLVTITISILTFIKNDYNDFLLAFMWTLVNILYQIRYYKDFKEIKNNF